MAKDLSEKEIKEILADYHTGQYSQRELAKKYARSLGTINKLTKTETPANEHIVNAQVTIFRANALLPSEQMNAIVNTAKDIVYNETLAFNASQLALIRSAELLSKNQTYEKINVGDGVQHFEPRELNTSDIKNLTDAIDKASVTLGVNDRFSKSTVEVNNINAQQNQEENITISVKR